MGKCGKKHNSLLHTLKDNVKEGQFNSKLETGSNNVEDSYKIEEVKIKPH